jgi:hypothetical protein
MKALRQRSGEQAWCPLEDQLVDDVRLGGEDG